MGLITLKFPALPTNVRRELLFGGFGSVFIAGYYQLSLLAQEKDGYYWAMLLILGIYGLLITATVVFWLGLWLKLV